MALRVYLFEAVGQLFNLIFAFAVGYAGYLVLDFGANLWNLRRRLRGSRIISAAPRPVPKRKWQLAVITSWEQRFNEEFAKAGIDFDFKRALQVALLGGLVGLYLGASLGRTVMASTIGLTFGMYVPFLLIGRLLGARKVELERQMASAFEIFATEYIYTPKVEVAFERTSEKLPSPIKDVFRDTATALRHRRPEQVLPLFAKRLDHPYGYVFTNICFAAYENAGVGKLFLSLAAKMHGRLVQEKDYQGQLVGLKVLNVVFITLMPFAYFFNQHALGADTLPGYDRIAFLIMLASLVLGQLVNRFASRL